jgi:hypothetical protein
MNVSLWPRETFIAFLTFTFLALPIPTEKTFCACVPHLSRNPDLGTPLLFEACKKGRHCSDMKKGENRKQENREKQNFSRFWVWVGVRVDIATFRSGSRSVQFEPPVHFSWHEERGLVASIALRSASTAGVYNAKIVP